MPRGLQWGRCALAFPVLARLTILVSLGMLPIVELACTRTAEPQRRAYPIRGQILAVGQARPRRPTGGFGHTRGHPRLHAGDDHGVFRQGGRVTRRYGPGGPVHRRRSFSRAARPTSTRLKKTGHAAAPGRTPNPSRSMDVMEPGDEVPDEALKDQAGRPGSCRTGGDGPGRHVRVHAMSAAGLLPVAGSALRATCSAPSRPTQALRDRVHLVSVSFDPAHDTAAVIRAHAKARGADPRTWSYLTGSPAADRSPDVAIRRVHNRDKDDARSHHAQPADGVVDRARTAGEGPLGQRLDGREPAGRSAAVRQ